MADQLDLKLQRGTFGDRSLFSFCLQDTSGNQVVPGDDAISDIQFIGGTTIQRLLSDGGLSVDTANNVVWSPTWQEIETLPQGRKATYYIEVLYKDGSGERFLEGFLIVNGLAVVPATMSDAKQSSTGNNAPTTP